MRSYSIRWSMEESMVWGVTQSDGAWRRVWYDELLSQREHGGEYGMRSSSVRGSMEESMV